MNFGAILMLGAGSDSPPAKLVWQAQQAALLDFINLIKITAPVKLILSAPDFSWLPPSPDVFLEPDPPDTPFHFGTRLADLIEKYQLETILYSGGGSAPLVNADIIHSLFDEISSAQKPLILTNNHYSSDWAIIHQTEQAIPLLREINRDNSLAWVLSESGNYSVKVPSEVEKRPSLNLDIDTPTDLAILRLHPDTQPHLRKFLHQTDALENIPLQAVIDTLKRNAAQVTLVGRVSPQAWLALNKVTRCWIRVFAEERGMVASERLHRGEVRSMLYELLKVQGAEKFFATLADISEAVILDSRVLMAAHYQNLPDERFASDLFLIDTISDPWLRDFTLAARNAPIPVLPGGHSVVAGGLYAIAEIISRGG